jgi:hypothetical protein
MEPVRLILRVSQRTLCEQLNRHFSSAFMERSPKLSKSNASRFGAAVGPGGHAGCLAQLGCAKLMP